jgi:hypothetical protein
MFNFILLLKVQFWKCVYRIVEEEKGRERSLVGGWVGEDIGGPNPLQ